VDFYLTLWAIKCEREADVLALRIDAAAAALDADVVAFRTAAATSARDDASASAPHAARRPALRVIPSLFIAAVRPLLRRQA